MDIEQGKNGRLALAPLLVSLAFWLSFSVSAESVVSEQDHRASSLTVSTWPSDWTPSETWAWRQIAAGQTADFDALLGTVSDSGRKSDNRFDDPRRILRPAFLRAVLAPQPFGHDLPRAGIRIHGAVFDAGVDLRDAVLNRVLAIADSRFAGPLVLNRIRTPTSISFDGSEFEDDISLDSVRIGGDLLLTNGKFISVVLKNAVVDGSLPISGSRVVGKLNMNALTVGGSLFVNDGVYDEVDLKTAKIGRQLQADDYTFGGTLDMGALSTGGHLLMRDGSQFQDMILRSAHIGGQVGFSDSVFLGRLDAESMTVGQHLHMLGTRFDGDVDLPFVWVAGSVDFGRATRSTLNLTGATVT